MAFPKHLLSQSKVKGCHGAFIGCRLIAVTCSQASSHSYCDWLPMPCPATFTSVTLLHKAWDTSPVAHTAPSAITLTLRPASAPHSEISLSPCLRRIISTVSRPSSRFPASELNSAYPRLHIYPDRWLHLEIYTVPWVQERPGRGVPRIIIQEVKRE